MRHIIITLCVALICALPLLASTQEKTDSLHITVHVLDAVTDMPIADASVCVGDTLGNVFFEALPKSENNRSYRQAYTQIDHTGVVPRHSHYRLTVSAPNYESRTFVAECNEKSFFWKVDDVYLHRPRKEMQLREVTVTATKVKMVMKGDTLEYDATAFELPQGSMLDALINELPGAELHEGRITVNGQFVSELLVNGRKFFAGDPQVALQNLPAYTVNKVKVYQKTPDEFVGLNMPGRDRSQDPLVMDVNLKHQYLGGWIANVQGGYGSALGSDWASRWMGRAFGMRYTKRDYIALQMGANNLNDGGLADSKGNWYSPGTSTGLVTYKQARLEYNTAWRDNQPACGVNTSVKVLRETNLQGQQEYSEQYIAGGNTYSRRNATTNTGTWEAEWNGEVSRRFNSVGRLWFGANIDWKDGTTRRLSASAQSNSMLPEGFTRPGSEAWVQDILYLRQQTSGEKTRTLEGTFRFSGPKYLDKDYFAASINADGSFLRKRMSGNSTDQIDYQTSVRTVNQWLTRPENKFQYSIEAQTWGSTRRFNYQLNYKFTHQSNTNSRRLEEDQILDLANSFDNQQHSFDHNLSARIILGWGQGRGKGQVSLSGNATHTEQQLTDTRADLRRCVNRHDWHGDGKLNFNIGESFWENCYGFDLIFSQRLPDLLNMLDVPDTGDPLIVRLGNPDLQTATTYTTMLYFKKSFGKMDQSVSIELNGEITDNDIAQARFYDRETGVTTWMPCNVGGYKQIYADLYFSTYLDRAKRLNLDNTLSPSWVHSVDYSSESDMPVQSAAERWRVSDRMHIDYKFGKVTINGAVNYTLTHQQSLSGLFAPFTFHDINYSIGASAMLPKDFTVSTLLTAYCRRGYQSPELNNTDWVWNVTASKTFGSAKQFTATLTGYDILHQLPTFTTEINAKGRSELRQNSQPAYLILTLAYRLDLKPHTK